MKYDHNKNEILSPTAEIPVVIEASSIGLYNKSGNINTGVDAFGRARVSQPFTLFDSNFKYQDNDKWSIANSGNSSSTYLANASAMLLNVGTNSGDSVIRETKRVFSYQPGKSLLNLNTFVMAPPKDNLCQRVGYYSANNGIYLEQANNIINIVKRSYSNGSIIETRVPQSSWSVNKLDGTDKSINVTLDLSKSQIFWTDIEWLGVGSVRTGFIINGQYVPCHIFHHANYESNVYITTASLPVRYEIRNSGTTTSSSNLKQICSTVISEGGYESRAPQYVSTRTDGILANSASSGNYAPLVSIRLAPGREDAVILTDALNAVGTGNNAIYEWALIRGASISGGVWSTHISNNVQYNSNANTMSGGIVIDSGMFTASQQASQVVNNDLAYNFEFQLTRDQTPTSDTMTLAVRGIASPGTVYGSMGWKDLT